MLSSILLQGITLTDASADTADEAPAGAKGLVYEYTTDAVSCSL